MLKIEYSFTKHKQLSPQMVSQEISGGLHLEFQVLLPSHQYTSKTTVDPRQISPAAKYNRKLNKRKNMRFI
jgi:hypothetical protein